MNYIEYAKGRTDEELKNEFNDLALRVNNTELGLDKKNSNSGIWVVSILSLLVGCAAIFLIFKLASGYDA